MGLLEIPVYGSLQRKEGSEWADFHSLLENKTRDWLWFDSAWRVCARCMKSYHKLCQSLCSDHVGSGNCIISSDLNYFCCISPALNLSPSLFSFVGTSGAARAEGKLQKIISSSAGISYSTLCRQDELCWLVYDIEVHHKWGEGGFSPSVEFWSIPNWFFILKQLFLHKRP